MSEAEGIENRATADLLLSMGCEEGQGYFFGRPMPAQALESRFLAAPESAAEASGAGKAA
jgi:EAL domain-containing protein (putative c-di-GMP-specific phosphodiesterase class I)